MQETKLQFYEQIIYGESNFYHPNKQKLIRKIIKVRTTYQDVLNNFNYPFPCIPKSLQHLYDFADRTQYIEEDRETIDFFDDYFLYGREQLELYHAIGIVDNVPTKEELLKNNLNQLVDFDDEIFKSMIITNTNHIYKKFNKGSFYNNVLTLKQLDKHLKTTISHVILSGGVGTGKTTLINDYIKEYGSSYDNVICLCPRTSLKLQTKNNLSDLNELNESALYNDIEIVNCEVDSYQHFFTIHEKLDDKKRYLIICDESQYTTEDALFNNQTYKLSSFFNENKHCCSFIFLTASGRIFLDDMINNNQDVVFYEYYIPNNFSHINHFYFYSDKKEVKPIIDDTITQNRKAIIFSDNIKTWRYMRKEFTDTQLTMVQSKHKPTEEDEKRLKNWLERESMIKYCKGQFILDKNTGNSSFSSSILVSTKTLDVGVNIIDENNAIKNVFIEVFDWNTAYQELGRVRANYINDKQVVSVNVFFKFPTQKEFEKQYQNYLQNLYNSHAHQGFIKSMDFYKNKVNEVKQLAQSYKDDKENEEFKKLLKQYQKYQKAYNCIKKAHEKQFESITQEKYENLKNKDTISYFHAIKQRFKINYQSNPKMWYQAYKDVFIDYAFNGDEDIKIDKYTAFYKGENESDIINQYLDKQLKSKDIKAIAQICGWYDEQRHILSVDKTIDKLNSLEYEVEKLPKKYEKSVQLYMIKK